MRRPASLVLGVALLAGVCVAGSNSVAAANSNSGSSGLRSTPADSSGQVWVRRYNGPGNGQDIAAALRVSPDGSHIYVTGKSWGGSPSSGGTGQDFATIAYKPGGYAYWVRRFNGPANGADAATAVTAAPGRVYVTGWSTGTGTGQDFETLAYTSSGTPLWQQRYDGPASGDDQATAIAVSSDGSQVFVSGPAIGTGGAQVYETIAYGQDGTELWSASLGPGTGAHSYVTVSPDGSRVYVTAQTGGSAFLTAAYDAATGTEVWTNTYQPSSDEASSNAIAVSNDGSRVIVSGDGCSECDMGPTENGVLLAYAKDGSLLWHSENEGVDFYTMALSPDSKVVYAGGQIGLSCPDTFAFGALTGTLRWERSHCGDVPNGGGWDTAIVAGPNGGNVFALASTYSSFLTLRYTTAGTFVWARSFNGPGRGYESATSIGVSPDGSQVYVTGGDPGLHSKDDFATIAYSAA